MEDRRFLDGRLRELKGNAAPPGDEPPELTALLDRLLVATRAVLASFARTGRLSKETDELGLGEDMRDEAIVALDVVRMCALDNITALAGEKWEQVLDDEYLRMFLRVYVTMPMWRRVYLKIRDMVGLLGPAEMRLLASQIEIASYEAESVRDGEPRHPKGPEFLS